MSDMNETRHSGKQTLYVELDGSDDDMDFEENDTRVDFWDMLTESETDDKVSSDLKTMIKEQRTREEDSHKENNLMIVEDIVEIGDTFLTEPDSLTFVPNPLSGTPPAPAVDFATSVFPAPVLATFTPKLDLPTTPALTLPPPSAPTLHTASAPTLSTASAPTIPPESAPVLHASLPTLIPASTPTFPPQPPPTSSHPLDPLDPAHSQVSPSVPCSTKIIETITIEESENKLEKKPDPVNDLNEIEEITENLVTKSNNTIAKGNAEKKTQLKPIIMLDQGKIGKVAFVPQSQRHRKDKLKPTVNETLKNLKWGCLRRGCFYRFSERSELKEHLSSHPMKEKIPIVHPVCKRCGKVLNTQWLQKYHMKTHAPQEYIGLFSAFKEQQKEKITIEDISENSSTTDILEELVQFPAEPVENVVDNENISSESFPASTSDILQELLNF